MQQSKLTDEQIEILGSDLLRERTARYLAYKKAKTHALEDSTPEATGDLSRLHSHPSDDASDIAEQGTQLSIADHEATVLNFINSALERIKSGTYGLCATCDCEIGFARLKAVPHATRCLECQSERDVRRHYFSTPTSIKDF